MKVYALIACVKAAEVGNLVGVFETEQQARDFDPSAYKTNRYDSYEIHETELGPGPTLGQAVLGICGIAAPPFGIIHGIMIWFGVGLG